MKSHTSRVKEVFLSFRKHTIGCYILFPPSIQRLLYLPFLFYFLIRKIPTTSCVYEVSQSSYFQSSIHPFLPFFQVIPYYGYFRLSERTLTHHPSTLLAFMLPTVQRYSAQPGTISAIITFGASFDKNISVV